MREAQNKHSKSTQPRELSKTRLLRRGFCPLSASVCVTWQGDKIHSTGYTDVRVAQERIRGYTGWDSSLQRNTNATGYS